MDEEKIHNTSDSDKKRNRIDSFAAALATRSQSINDQDFLQRYQQSSSSLQDHQQLLFRSDQSMNCSICGLEVQARQISAKETKVCSHCNRFVHLYCDEAESCGTYTCLSCRESPIVGGDAMLSCTMPRSSNANEFSDEEIGIIDSNAIRKSDINFSTARASQQCAEQHSSISTPLEETPSTSVGGSQTPTPQPDGTGSDNDEYIPGSIRRSESTRGGRGKGKKPINSADRQTTMKTRSGGKPPTTSYAAKFHTNYPDIEERFEGKRMRGNGAKGKGSARGRRNTTGGGGRGGKLISMYTAAARIGSRHESCQRDNSEDRRKITPEKNDYNRTVIVTSSDDKYMIEYPNLCLICGSIGKDLEGTMISCQSCAQSFHTYCVSMHDKLNMTLIKRGWRCLDCTICEGCGTGEDESNLLLCDECDISYHTYCLNPPLGCIPSGSWRCKWCSACARCNLQVKSGIDLQNSDGYCETCFSLRKCPKCHHFYEVGDLMLKCQHCLRWFHGACEGHSTEEQAENAAENAFRCSFCRPQTFNDALTMPVVVDNVMITKSMLEQIQGIHSLRRFSFFTGDHCNTISRSFSNDQDEGEMNDELREQFIANIFSMRGRGGSVRGGPGRRVLKLGIGGFNVRNPKSRTLQSLPAEDEVLTPGADEDGNAINSSGPNGKPRIRRPRKLRKPQLEDAYPANIQESFFGVPAVESRVLAEQNVDEPLLNEYKKNCAPIECTKASELSEHTAELLRNEQEMDMLGDIPLVEDIGLDMDIENLDFSDLIVGGDEEESAAADAMDSMDEGFNAGSTSSLIQNSAAEICSPSSASSIRTPSRMNESVHFPTNIPGSLANQKRSAMFTATELAKPIEQNRLSSAAITTERWEEDEPLGDKATKAAVLYANVHHPNLKDKFPHWADRLRQINKLWRELEAPKRHEFVELARKNRVNCPTARKRGRRSTLTGLPGKQTPEMTQDSIKRIANDSPTTSRIPMTITAGSSTMNMKIESTEAALNANFLGDQSIKQHDAQCQMRTMEFRQELEIEEKKIEQMKKTKRALAAKQRQIVKQMQLQPIMPDEAGNKEVEMRQIETNLNSAKKAIQVQQRVVDKHRQRLKEHLETQQQKQLPHQHIGVHQQQQSNRQGLLQSPLQQQSAFLPSTSSIIPKDIGFQQQFCNEQQAQFKVENPLCTATLLSTSTPIQQTKGTRGRKRKKPLLEQIRAPVLGGIAFADLQTQLEKDVYDTVDGLLQFIDSNSDEKSADALFVKRILLSQQQQVPFSPSMLKGTTETQKTKKKRQTQPKGRNQLDLNTEFEQVQERVKEALVSFPNFVNSLEQYQANDKTMLKYPDQTLDHYGSVAPFNGKEIGNFSLPFMPDVYDELETCREDYIDEESLFPPTMAEICIAVDLDELENNNDEEMKEIAEIFDSEENLTDELDFPSLSIDNIGDRSQLIKSALILGSSGPEMQVPIEPHWSRFDEKPKDLDREVEVILEIDPSKMSREEFMENLRELLGVSDLTAMEIETPPQTPASPKTSAPQQNNGIIQSDQKPESQQQEQPSQQDEQGQSTIDSSKLFCKKCGELVPTDRQPIEDFPNRLGLFNEETSKVVFCSMACYFKFLAICRVPLTVNKLELAERCVDEETVEILRQISVDNFAKRIHAGLHPHSGFFDDNAMDMNYAIPCSSTNLLENAHLPRDFHLRLAELSALVQSSGIGQERKKAGSEYKWKGHGWTRCDSTLLQSFLRQQEEIKQKLTAMQLQTSSKGRNLQCVDTRHCSFCSEIGDGDQELTGRLLNVDANEWVHVNCALWSAEVHVSEEGALMNVESALRKAQKVECKICGRFGASIRCYKLDCVNKEFAFHLLCAKRSNGNFVKDKTYFCANHELKPEALINRLDALRRLYIQRDENQLLSKIFNHSCSTEMVMRVGSLVFYKIGQLLPEQLKAFTTSDFIFPVGYKIARIFWSLTNAMDRERMSYECSIADKDGVPEFVVKVMELDREFRAQNPTAAWLKIQQQISSLREKTSSNMLRFFPAQITGETLFGFMETSISKMLESLPGIDQLYTYTFKHGGTPLMDLPLAENPSGCARCEPSMRTLIKRKHRPIISNSPKKTEIRMNGSEAVVSRDCRVRVTSSRFSASSAKFDQEMIKAYKASGINERMLQAPYLKSNEAAQLISQYKEMKKEWKENVYLARSKIQGLGLYAQKDLDMNQMIIEYIGEMIRNEVCEIRQKRYLEQNRGEYMFRIDADWVVDATMKGGPARYINHSCDPNCGTRILTVSDEKKIVIFANRPVKAGEELTYDYQFELEEVTKKIPCLCGAPNCARWMN